MIRKILFFITFLALWQPHAFSTPQTTIDHVRNVIVISDTKDHFIQNKTFFFDSYIIHHNLTEEDLSDFESNEPLELKAIFKPDSRGFVAHLYVVKILALESLSDDSDKEEEKKFQYDISALDKKDLIKKVVDKIASDWRDDDIDMGGDIVVTSGILSLQEPNVTKTYLKGIAKQWLSDFVIDELEWEEFDPSTVKATIFKDPKKAIQTMVSLINRVGFDYDPSNKEIRQQTTRRVIKLYEAIASLETEPIVVYVRSVTRENAVIHGFVLLQELSSKSKGIFIFLYDNHN